MSRRMRPAQASLGYAVAESEYDCGEQLDPDIVDASLQCIMKTDLSEAADQLDSQRLLCEDHLPWWGRSADVGHGPSHMGVSSSRPPKIPSESFQQSSGEDLEAVKVMMREALSRLELHSNLEAVDASSHAEWAQQVHSIVLQPESFKAGFISTRLPVWQIYFDKYGWTSKAKMVCSWLKDGFNVQWVPIHHPSQLKHPRFQKRLKLVQDLLIKTVGPDRAMLALAGKEPQEVVFQNRVSVRIHRDFVAAELSQLLLIGVIKQWDMQGPMITVINGLGVVENRKGKRRLILDARYINMFDKYTQFSYEQLDDVTSYVRPGDYIALTDFKSGYHQLKMHPARTGFLVFSMRDKCTTSHICPFGLSCACRAYTVMMGEVYRPLRMHGQDMTYLIDDALYKFLNKLRAQFQMLTNIMVLTALGFFLSLPKCQPPPVQSGKFLGLLINTKFCAFEVPEDKVVYIMQLIEECLQAQSVSSRQLAQVAGVLLSVKGAEHMAPLYCRCLFRAMCGTSPWDSPIPDCDREFAASDLRYWKDLLAHGNGKSWVKRSNVIHASGDVSDVGYAGHCALLPVPIIMSYSEIDRQLVSERALSSVLRETVNAKLVLETIMTQQCAAVKGGLIVYKGDNQGSIDCLRKMNGKGVILDVVRDLYKISTLHDVQLEFEWLPRSSDTIEYVDALSRIVDGSDFALSHHVFVRICQKIAPDGKIWGFPTCDVFAGGAKDFHKASRYFTLYFCPCTSGINGLRQSWTSPECCNHSENRQVCPGLSADV